MKATSPDEGNGESASYAEKRLLERRPWVKRPGMSGVNLIGGITAAVAVATMLVVPSVAGIDTWKIVLGVVGLVLFFSAGTVKPRV